MSRRPIICLDFDGTIHSYNSPWRAADIISDGPVPGALDFIFDLLPHYRVCIFSSRSSSPGGVAAMRSWLERECRKNWPASSGEWWDQVEFPTNKPAAFVSIDDRALTFRGVWPTLKEIGEFRPWNKPEGS